MTGWFRINSDLLEYRAAQQMGTREFVRKFTAAAHGEQNELSEYVRPCRHGRPGQTEWAAIRSKIFERDNYTCTYCGERGGRLECDHIVPVSRGGTHKDDNLTTACFDCNRSKRNKLLEEWRQ